jgi:hypothetical protein
MEVKCEKCSGLGYTVETDIMKARRVKKDCPSCKGTGKIQNIEPDGVIFRIKRCEVGYWQELRAGKPVATLHMHICPIMDSTGKPLFKRNIMNPKQGIPRIFIQIVNMVTKPKYRKTGIMTKLLSAAMGDPKIEWVESSWDDSTDFGRNFLLARGFVQEGSKIIWRRTDVAKN